MAENSIRMKVKLKNNIATVKAIISHPMESGNRKQDGVPVPAHFIQEVECFVNDASVLKTYWGGGVQKNPYFSFRLKEAKMGDKVKLTWKDHTGDSDSKEVLVSG
jgi:sulfur-oxidizing protein SoxZ